MPRARQIHDYRLTVEGEITKRIDAFSGRVHKHRAGEEVKRASIALLDIDRAGITRRRLRASEEAHFNA